MTINYNILSLGTQDERNSLLDLSRECKKSLSNLDSTSIDAALSAIHQITGEMRYHSVVSDISYLCALLSHCGRRSNQTPLPRRAVSQTSQGPNCYDKKDY